MPRPREGVADCDGRRVHSRVHRDRSGVGVDPKEGWGVKNNYVIASVRSMESNLLTEHILGRGLRLPFGQRTGNPDARHRRGPLTPLVVSLLKRAKSLLEQTLGAGSTRRPLSSTRASASGHPVRPSGRRASFRQTYRSHVGDGGSRAAWRLVVIAPRAGVQVVDERRLARPREPTLPAQAGTYVRSRRRL